MIRQVSGGKNPYLKDSDKIDIIFPKPIFKEKIWGGKRLNTKFFHQIPSNITGEMWAISAHEHGMSIIEEGQFEGMQLAELYKERPDLFFKNPDTFDAENDEFPLLVKIIDAKEDLSIQVHPDTAYAKVNDNGSLGKTECWYVLECDDDSELIMGHNAKTKAELEDMVSNGRWDDFVKRIPIKPGDFVQINPGTVHALCKGTTVLETQETSDVTYRLYDYERLHNGRKRELHVKKALDVIQVPDKSGGLVGNFADVEPNTMVEIISCDSYTLWKVNVKNEFKLRQDKDFMNVSVVEGDGLVNGKYVRKGMHFLLPCGIDDVLFIGNMELVISAP